LASATRFDLRERASLIRTLADFFAERSVPAWATGGFLRDTLLGRVPHDVDVVIDGDPLVLAPPLADALGGHFFALREERGQARIVLAEDHVYIDLMPVRAPDILADLRLRDYTIDAMAAPLDSLAGGRLSLLDPLDGEGDLRAAIVRMTSEQAFRDDPLRLLRGPRIANELGFEIEVETVATIRRLAATVNAASAERIRDEVIRIFSTPTAGAGVRLLDGLGLFSRIFPEMETTRGVEQPKEHHHDVLGHSFAAVDALDAMLADAAPQPSPGHEIWADLWSQLEWCGGLRDYFAEEIVQGTTRGALLKLCGLLHDIAKPQTKSFEPNGRMRFFGHSEMGAEMAAGLLRRLRFSSREVDMVGRMIDAHLRPVQLGQQGLPSRRAVYKFFRDTGDAGIDTLFLSLADHVATVGPRFSREAFDQHVALTGYILHLRLEDEKVISPPRLVDGDVLMAELGLEPGPFLGQLLEAVREAQAASEIETREQALEFARSRLAEERAAGRQ
jgi:putative nucleotidyltransferase with HDIG domain